MPAQPLSYRQITVSGFPVGLNGLEEIFQQLYEAHRPADGSTAEAILQRVRDHNYIPASAEAAFGQALLREYGRYCELTAAGKTLATREPWQGYEREQVPWFPTLDESNCDGCDRCLEFCSHGVFSKRENGKVFVAEPFDCVVGCDACARLCSQKAITFPPRKILMLMTDKE